MPYFTKLLVVDLEATCWDNPYNYAPVGQQREIIEVGICQLDLQTLERSRKKSILVRPTESTVSDFCTELTSLTDEKLNEEGVTFEKAHKILRKEYGSRNKPWASWGAWDQTMMHVQCERRNLEYPFHPYHVNISAEFFINTGRRRTVGLRKAMRCLDLEFEGTHHRGDDDAWNTAGVFIAMQERIREAMKHV